MAFRDRYQFTRRQSRCAVTDVPFTDGQLIHTAIFIGLTEEGYLRKDYSQSGWEQRPSEDAAPYSNWVSQWKKPERSPEEQPLEKQSAERLLDRLHAEDDPATQSARYVLALMLERARLLTEEGSQKLPHGKGLLRIYRHKKTDARYSIHDPELSLDQLAGLQQEVIDLLDGKR